MTAAALSYIVTSALGFLCSLPPAIPRRSINDTWFNLEPFCLTRHNGLYALRLLIVTAPYTVSAVIQHVSHSNTCKDNGFAVSYLRQTEALASSCIGFRMLT